MPVLRTGVEVSLTNLAMGIKFSWPLYKNGFSVLVSGHAEQPSTWAFTQAFSLAVWVALGGTAVAVGILVSITDYVTHGDKANKKGFQVQLLSSCRLCVCDWTIDSQLKLSEWTSQSSTAQIITQWHVIAS